LPPPRRHAPPRYAALRRLARADRAGRAAPRAGCQPSLCAFCKKGFAPLAHAQARRPLTLAAASPGIDLLKAYGNVVEAFDMSPADLCAKISLCDALIVRSATKVTKEVFAAGAGRLKVVGRAGVGIDNVDLGAATEAGVLVVNAPTANTVAAAEHGIALLCALSRFVPQADASMKAGKWERPKYTGVSLVGKTLAIMGFGKVGSEVARRAKGLSMTVIAYDPFAPAERAKALGVELVSFDDACARGDFFSLHMPLTPSTQNLFNDATFAKMKKGARIINVARGGVIDDDALVRALDSKHIAAAALDVFEIEPPLPTNPLVKRADVICTPHLGASTVEAQEGVAVEIAEAVVGALNGELAATAVNAPMVSPELLTAMAPFIGLAEKLGRIVLQLVDASTGVSDVTITFKGSNKEDLDTRLLRAMVIKGLLERDTATTVNLVNADVLAKSRCAPLRA
jgi:D-3-phosphoglycerate dehydrogenase